MAADAASAAILSDRRRELPGAWGTHYPRDGLARFPLTRRGLRGRPRIQRMRLLFIKPKHIGDTLLLTPTLVAARQAYPGAEIWVLVRKGCEKILAGCPEINRILLLAGVDRTTRTAGDMARQLAILARLAATRFDYVFELGDGHRARLFARVARSPKRFSVKPDAPLRGAERRAFAGVSSFDWGTVHRVVKDYRSVAEFLPLPAEIPTLRFDRQLARTWPPAASLRNFAVLQIGTRQAFNRWSLDGWRTVCAHLLTQVDSVVIGSGSAETEIAEATNLESEFGSKVLATKGKADWAQIADLLYRARLYLGPATAAMHLAAACACPSVVLFGRTIEEHWHPWRAPYLAVQTVNLTGVNDPEERYRLIKERTMLDTPVAEVVARCNELLDLPSREDAA